MTNALYLLIIMPVSLLIETAFVLIYRLTNDAGFSIVAVSLVVNVLVLPLYLRADTVQQAEREKQLRMEPFIRHIKKTFRGTEQYMMLSTLYRQNSYSPLHALRGTFSLLLQAPFFIAAYRFLSGLSLLSGVSWFFIRDLAMPDRLLAFGGSALNLLPVLMTLLNVISVIVYTKGAPFREKLQAFALAALFLVLLYDSPSGLVLYWTCNQLFSIVKNVVMAHLPAAKNGKPHPQRETAAHLSSGVPAAGLRHPDHVLFLVSALCLTLLTGALIPSAVIADSPLEFINLQHPVSPVRYVTGALCIAAGCFLLWGGIIYILAGTRAKRILAVIFAALGIVFPVHYFVFPGNSGVLSAELTYEAVPRFPFPVVLVSALLTVALFILVALAVRKINRFVAPILGIVTVSLLVMTLFNVHVIRRESAPLLGENNRTAEADGTPVPILRFSESGRNVIVIMLDRAISGYIPYIMQEKPQLAAQFDGFTYYPNTISHGAYTVFGAPELFGGYDYTVSEMNARDREPLVQKHNEALRVMPVLFSEEGFQVTVCDPPFANYKWIPDLSVYDDLPDIRAYNTDGVYTDTVAASYEEGRAGLLTRNFFCYGLFRSSPLLAKGFFYDEGNYHACDRDNGLTEKFLNAYSVLANLIPLSETAPGPDDTFLMFANSTTHEPVLLQTPEYEPAPRVERSKPYEARLTLPDGSFVRTETEWQLAHYHVNMAALLEIGKWFDWMREAGIYDNTRIIIASDHGRFLGQFDNLVIDEYMDAQSVNALLMVKDFGADGALSTDTRFMTIADVPHLATGGVLAATNNPFTGHPLDGNARKQEDQRVTTSDHWRTTIHPRHTFDTTDGHWYRVRDNIFDRSNWKRED